MAFGAGKSGSTFPTELELGRVIGVTIRTAHETLFTVFAQILSGECGAITVLITPGMVMVIVTV